LNIIYLIECVNSDSVKYKIGYSKNHKTLVRRLKSIQTGNPDKCTILDTFETNHKRKVEIALHRSLSQCRREGEWFDLDLVQVTNFKSICEVMENGFDVLKENKNPYYGKFI